MIVSYIQTVNSQICECSNYTIQTTFNKNNVSNWIIELKEFFIIKYTDFKNSAVFIEFAASSSTLDLRQIFFEVGIISKLIPSSFPNFFPVFFTNALYNLWIGLIDPIFLLNNPNIFSPKILNKLKFFKYPLYLFKKFFYLKIAVAYREINIS